MSKIERVEIFLVNLKPKSVRSDAIQSFVSQETPIVKITTDDGIVGTGYSYTIGNGGSSIHVMLKDHLCPLLIGEDPSMIEYIWKKLFFHVHTSAIGPIVSLSLAAIDTALWDIKCLSAKQPLYKLAGGAQTKVPLYSTEKGWLHYSKEELVEGALMTKEAGYLGCKPKIGSLNAMEDVRRIQAVRDAVGSDFAIMVDANQSFTVSEAIRRARLLEPFDLTWFEEPLAAEDLHGHVRLCASSTLPIAVGESIYHLSHFREYLASDACTIIQADVARVGGITPWLKIAHLAESFNVQVCPHFLMELHVSLCAAVPNASWVEHIPQLDLLTTESLHIEDGHALVPSSEGLGISWNYEQIKSLCIDGAYVDIRV